MRILGVDLGTKRIGVALTDASATLASPLTTVLRTTDRQAVRRQLRELVAENEVELVVVGVPYSLDGSIGAAAQRALDEVEELRDTLGVPVETYDERLTTVTAERLLGDAEVRGVERRAVIDKVAAAVILQNWLDAAANSAASEERL